VDRGADLCRCAWANPSKRIFAIPRWHDVVGLIDEADVIERILRHLGLWEAVVRVESARDPPEPILDP